MPPAAPPPHHGSAKVTEKFSFREKSQLQNKSDSLAPSLVPLREAQDHLSTSNDGDVLKKTFSVLPNKRNLLLVLRYFFATLFTQLLTHFCMHRNDFRRNKSKSCLLSSVHYSTVLAGCYLLSFKTYSPAHCFTPSWLVFSLLIVPVISLSTLACGVRILRCFN